MAITDGENGFNVSMPVAPAYGMYGGNGGFGGFGGDSWGWVILLLLCANGGWGGFGGFGGFGNGFNNIAPGYDFPWLLNGQQNINANTNAGFRDSMLNDNITSVRDGIAGLSTQICGATGDIQNSLCNGFAGVNATVNGAQNALAQQMYTNQIADLERSYASQTAVTQGMNSIGMSLQNCCCENRAGLADLKYTVSSEECATRANDTQNTQAILDLVNGGIQSIKDQLCQDKIDAKNDTIAQLRSELLYARGQASQDVQTAAIQAGQRALANEVEQYVAPRAIPAYTVQNPNCCYNTCGCGCNM